RGFDGLRDDGAVADVQVAVFGLQTVVEVLFDADRAPDMRGAQRRAVDLLRAGVLQDPAADLFAVIEPVAVFARQLLAVTAVFLKPAAEAFLDHDADADARGVAECPDPFALAEHE